VYTPPYFELTEVISLLLSTKRRDTNEKENETQTSKRKRQEDEENAKILLDLKKRKIDKNSNHSSQSEKETIVKNNSHNSIRLPSSQPPPHCSCSYSLVTTISTDSPLLNDSGNKSFWLTISI
jgi:hypothetical protein